MPCTNCQKSDVRIENKSNKKIEAMPVPSARKNLASILTNHNISFLLCSEKSGYVIHVTSNGNKADTTLLSIPSPLSATLNGDDTIAIASKAHISLYRKTVDRKKGLVYSFSNPVITNDVDLHDLTFDADGQLYFANSLFSCLSKADLVHNFVPQWIPDFISELQPDRRCFLNGLALREDKPRYMTALAKTNDSQLRNTNSMQAIPCCKNGEPQYSIPKYWNAQLENSGVLIDIDNGTMIEGLCCPNSPRWYEGNLYFLDSGRGKLCRVDFNDDNSILDNATITDVANIPSFGRGLDFVGNLAFIGLSSVRRTSDTERLPIVTALSDAEQALMAATKLLEKQKNELQTPWSTEESAAIGIATEKLTIQQKAYMDLLSESNRCGLWVVDILRSEAMAYYQIDNVDGVNDVKLLPSDAQISTTTVQRGQRNVYKTPKKTFRR